MATLAEGNAAGFRFPGGKPVAFGLLLVLGIAGAAGGYIFATRMPAQVEPAQTVATPEPSEPAHGAAPTDDGHGAPVSEKSMAVTPFKEIIVNITATTATGRTTTRFMKLNVALVYDERLEGAGRIDERRLFLRDSFQDYLRQLTEQDLQGSLGIIIMKQELLRRARTITESMAPKEILVADLIVQ